MKQDVAYDKLVGDIRTGITLVHQGSGWESCHCPICGETRTMTGGFLFSDDTIIYKCFRGKCEHLSNCGYTKGEPISRKFRNLMSELGVKIPVQLTAVKSALTKAIEEQSQNELYLEHSFHGIDWPTDEFKLLSEDMGKVGDFWREKMSHRGGDIHDLRVMKAGEYRGSLLIPFRYGNKLIGWQYLTQKGVYVQHNGGNTNLIYQPRGHIPYSRVLLVEGAMDARALPDYTVATLNSSIRPEQAWFLRGKDVIAIPDRRGNKFIEQYADYGWKISIPDWSVKDLDEAVAKYGCLVVSKMIRDNIFTADEKFKAQVRYNTWREKK